MISLVKHNNQYWVTLEEYSSTRALGKRDTSSPTKQNYVGYDSLKSALRNFIYKYYPKAYQSFRGQTVINDIIMENKDNEMFRGGMEGKSRIGLIHVSVLEALEKSFPVRGRDKEMMDDFRTQLRNKLIRENEEKKHEQVEVGVESVKAELEKRGLSEDGVTPLVRKGEGTRKYNFQVEKSYRPSKAKTKNKQSRKQGQEVETKATPSYESENPKKSVKEEPVSRIGDIAHEPSTISVLSQEKGSLLSKLEDLAEYERNEMKMHEDNLRKIEDAITSLRSLSTVQVSGSNVSKEVEKEGVLV